jgi:hypothetical protein
MENSTPTGTEPNTETIKSTGDAVDYLLKTNEPSTEENSETLEESNNEETVQTEQNESEESTEEITEEETEETDNGEQYEEVDSTPEPERYTVKIDGQDQDVTLDDLKNSYLRQSDYTKKTQNLAEQRRQIENINATIQQERKVLSENLKATQQFLENGMVQQPDVSLLESDPVTYMKQKDAFEKHQAVLNQVKQEQINIQTQEQNDLIQNYQKNLEQEKVRLTEYIPEWKNQDVATKEKNNIVTYAKRLGFTPEELNSASDARAINVLRKAWLYDNLISKNKVAQKKVSKAPKMVKGGVPRNKNEVSQRNSNKLFDRLKKSGKQEDAINYLLSKQQ